MSEINSRRKFKVASIQASPVVRNAATWFDLESSLKNATSLIFKAGRNGARQFPFIIIF